MDLVDTSVWALRRYPTVGAWFAAALTAGDIACCDMIALELLHSARNPTEFARLEDGLRGMPWVESGDATWRRAREVYRILGSRPGMAHRSVRHPDLLIAAAAELAGMVLVHYDSDYDTIAQVTGQPARWIAPRGSL